MKPSFDAVAEQKLLARPYVDPLKREHGVWLPPNTCWICHRHITEELTGESVDTCKTCEEEFPTK